MCVGKAQSSPVPCRLRCALSSGKLDTHISKNEWGWEIRNTVMRPLSDLDCLLGWRSLRRLMQTWSLVLGRVSALIIGWSEKQANKIIFLSLKNASIIFKCKDYSWIWNQKGRSDEIMFSLLPPHLEWTFFLKYLFWKPVFAKENLFHWKHSKVNLKDTLLIFKFMIGLILPVSGGSESW